VRKIGTNRLISEKIVSWDFVLPFDFTISFPASGSCYPLPRICKILFGGRLFDEIRTFFEQNPEDFAD